MTIIDTRAKIRACPNRTLPFCWMCLLAACIKLPRILFLLFTFSLFYHHPDRLTTHPRLKLELYLAQTTQDEIALRSSDTPPPLPRLLTSEITRTPDSSEQPQPSAWAMMVRRGGVS